MLDVLPTILDLAGATTPHRYFGVAVLDDPTTAHRTYVFTEGGSTVGEEPQIECTDFRMIPKSLSNKSIQSDWGSRRGRRRRILAVTATWPYSN